MLRIPDRLVASVFEPLWDLYEGSRRLRTLRELERSQWWDWNRLEAARSQRLRRLATHAATTSPFYGDRFAQAGIDPQRVRTIGDLAGLPLLTKANVRGELQRILSTEYRQDDLVPAKTGGSTGEALRVFCDRAGIEERAAAALRADTWSGWRLGQPVAAVWGNPPVPRTLKNRVRRRVKDRVFFLDTMKIDASAIERFVAEWRRWRPGLLYGHAHSLYILAEALRDRGITLRPRAIVATSMMLIRPERQVIESVFGVPVTDRYGCEEVSLIACECEMHHGFHLNAEHAYVEFLRDDGSPCAAGEEGRIVVTELVNLGMPMIRYEVGDRGVPSDRTCPCGRVLPLMEGVTGRTADFLVAADGSLIAGISLIENTLTRYPGIAQLQVVQEEVGRVCLNVVRAPDWNETTAEALARVFRESLGGNPTVVLRFQDRIPPEPNGKYRFSICRVPGARRGA